MLVEMDYALAVISTILAPGVQGFLQQWKTVPGEEKVLRGYVREKDWVPA